MSIIVPPSVARHLGEVWGAPAERWLTELPGSLAALMQAWDLEIEAWSFGLAHHLVVPVRRGDGTQAVLKIGPPSSGQLATEAATLAAWAGHGAVRLLDHDPTRGALLLERIVPGGAATLLVPDRDADATAAAVAVMRQLHVEAPPGGALPRVERQGASLTNYLRDHPDNSILPRHLVQRAEQLFGELCSSAPRRVVLHGDLHHDNILRATRQPWLAIDPHGVTGDPGYDLGALLYNPQPDRRDDQLLRLVPARLEQLADGLTIPMERATAWGFVKAVLSEVWTVEDGGTPGGRALDVAQMLLPLLP
jgi:streptomycin 6-kinase